MKLYAPVKSRAFLSVALLSASAALTSAAGYRLNVADFNTLSVDNGVNVTYRCVPDSAGMVVFECDPELASKILLINNKSNLRVQVDIDEGIPQNLPLLHVYSSGLTGVTNSGDSLVVVSLAGPGEKFSARVIGNGTINIHDVNVRQAEAKVTAGKGFISIDGNADKAKLFIAGTGRIDASGLRAEEVRSASIGPGHIICNPSKKLSVSGLSGHVYYLTRPEELRQRGMGVRALPIDSLK